MAAGLAGGEIRLFDFDRHEPLATLAGHEWVIYGGADGTVRLWAVTNRRLIETYRWHRSWVTCVAVAPDGMTAAAGSNDHTVVLWDLADA